MRLSRGLLSHRGLEWRLARYHHQMKEQCILYVAVYGRLCAEVHESVIQDQHAQICTFDSMTVFLYRQQTFLGARECAFSIATVLVWSADFVHWPKDG